MRKKIEARIERLKAEARRLLRKHATPAISRIQKLLEEPTIKKADVMDVLTSMVHYRVLKHHEAINIDSGGELTPELRKRMLEHLGSGLYNSGKAFPAAEGAKSNYMYVNDLLGSQPYEGKTNKAADQQVHFRKYPSRPAQDITGEMLEQTMQAYKSVKDE